LGSEAEPPLGNIFPGQGEDLQEEGCLPGKNACEIYIAFKI
jgi:hypothetical protein